MHYYEEPNTNGYSRKKQYNISPLPNQKSKQHPHNSNREIQRLKRYTISASTRNGLKQNISELTKFDLDRKHPLLLKSIHFIKDSLQQSTSINSNRNVQNVGKIKHHNLENFHKLNRKIQQQIQQTIQRVYRRRIALGFQKIKEQLLVYETSESDIGICQKPIYNYEQLPELLEAYSNVYRLRYQHVMVEAFTKIAHQFKKAQQRYSALRQLVIKDRKIELYRHLKLRNKVMELNTLVKSTAFVKFINKINYIVKNKQTKRKKIIGTKRRSQRIHIDSSCSLDSIQMGSAAKISRLVGNIKKSKDQPCENVYIKYNSPHSMAEFTQRMSQNFPTAIEHLTGRVQRLEEMFVDRRSAHSNNPYPTIENKCPVESQRKFQPITQNWSHSSLYVQPDPTQSKLSSNFSSTNIIKYCTKCQLTFCICKKDSKDFELQYNLNAIQPVFKRDSLKPVNQSKENRSVGIIRSQSVPRNIFVLTPQQTREMQLVYEHQTLLRPVLIERSQTYQYRPQMPIYQQAVLVKDLPKMTPDVLQRNNESQQPFSKKRQAENSIEKSISKRSKFLKVTVKRPSGSQQ